MSRSVAFAVLCLVLFAACGGGPAAPPASSDNHAPVLLVSDQQGGTLVIHAIDVDGDDVEVRVSNDGPTPRPIEGWSQMVGNGDGEVTFHFPEPAGNEWRLYVALVGFDRKVLGEAIEVELHAETAGIAPGSVIIEILPRIKYLPPQHPHPEWIGSNPIVVSSGPTVGAFHYLDAIWITFPQGYRYMSESLAPGYIFRQIGNKDGFLLPETFDGMMQTPIELPDGRLALAVSLSPLGGSSLSGVEGSLFGFKAKFPNGLIEVGFVQPPYNQRSYYSSADGSQTFWEDLSNVESHNPSVLNK